MKWDNCPILFNYVIQIIFCSFSKFSPAVSGAISFLLRSLLSSSRRLLAISAGERGVSLKAEVDAAAEAEADGEEEDIMGEREFCCRLSIASYLSRLYRKKKEQ